jgi:hypothetical protein
MAQIYDEENNNVFIYIHNIIKNCNMIQIHKFVKVSNRDMFPEIYRLFFLNIILLLQLKQ